MQANTLTAGEECQIAAKCMSSFTDDRGMAIPSSFIVAAMGVAVVRGCYGTAAIRLKSGGKFHHLISIQIDRPPSLLIC